MMQDDPGSFAPYPGLRSFLRDETAVFFGRDGAVHDMLGRLSASRFLAVLGSSGSGKSSLVRTGMLEGLEMGLIAEAGSRWRIIDIRPGSDPLRALAQALCAEDAAAGEVDQMRAFLLEGPRALVEWARAGHLAPGENLLLLVDQFEELFRYRDYDGHQEAEAFVALILESRRSRDVAIYVTITMRSEYLGACALFNGLAEAMNQGQYLTPRLGRDQCRAAIEGPAAVCGFSLEPELVTALLNDLARFAPWQDAGDGDLRAQLDMIGRRADQLPLLQHVLNRLWLQAVDRNDPAGIVLRVADYTALGGLRGAIDQHADSIANSLPPAAAAILPAVFRALTTGSNVAEAVRRPTRLSTLAEVCATDIATVESVISAFRDPGRNFLTPAPPAPLLPETVIDISHESLIRQWTRLSAWLEAEARDTVSLRRLDEAADREATGRGELLDGRDLAPLAAWRNDSALPTAWAARYIREPDRAFDFLDRSVRAAAKKRQVQRLLKAGAVAVGVVIAGLTTVFVLERNRTSLLQSQNVALLDEKASLQAGVEELRAEALSIRAEAETMRQEAATRRAEAEAAKAAAAEAAAEADASQAMAAAALAEADTAQAEAAAATAEAASAQAEATAAAAEAASAKAEATAAEAEARAAKVEAEVARADAVASLEQSDKARADAEVARAQAEEAQQAATVLRETAADLSAKLESVATRYLETARFVVEHDLLQGGTPFLPDAISALQLLSPANRAPFASAATWTVVLQRAFGRKPAASDLSSTMLDGTTPLYPFSGQTFGYGTGTASPFGLMRGPETTEGNPTYAVIDHRSGYIAHRLTLSYDLGNEVAFYAVSLSGRSLLLETTDGALLRWEAGQPAPRRVLDRSWLRFTEAGTPISRFISAAVFDETTGDIGVQYMRNDIAHYTILPLSGASTAPVWRQSELVATLSAAAAVPGAQLGTVRADEAYFELAGLRDGAFLLLAEPSFESGHFPVLIDMATGRAERIGPVLGPPGGLTYLLPTTDPDKVNLAFQPQGQTCPTDGSAPAPDPQIDPLMSCLATLDLATGQITALDQPVLNTLFSSVGMPASPIDPTSPWQVGGTSEGPAVALPTPPLLLTPPPVSDTPATLPVLADWGLAQPLNGEIVNFYGNLEVIHHPDGMDILSRDPDYLVGTSTRADAPGGDPGRHIVAAWRKADLPALTPSDHFNRPATVAPDGSFVLTTDGKKDLRLHRSATMPLSVVLPLRLDGSCETLLQSPATASTGEATATSDRAQEAGVAARNPLDQLLSGGISLDRAVSANGQWALVLLTAAQQYALIRIDDPAGPQPFGTLHCPAARDMTRVLAVDHATGRVVMAGKAGRQIAVWSVPKARDGAVTSHAGVLPNRQTAAAATFLPDGGVLIVGTDGSLATMPTGQAVGPANGPTQLTPLQGAPLPGADRVQAAGNRVLFLRSMGDGESEGSDDPINLWTLAALIEVNPSTGDWNLTHAAALPVDPTAIAGLRPDAPPGGIEIMLADGILMRITLPPVPQGDALVDEVLTLASPDIVIGNRTDTALAAVGLVLTSLSEEMALPPLRVASACAGRIEAAIAALPGADMAELAPGPACADPRALDLLAVLSLSDPAPSVTGFGPRESALLARAAAGDPLALRALVALWSNSPDRRPTDPVFVVAATLDQGLLSAGTGLQDDTLAFADPASGDAISHLRLARAAMGAGDPALAYRHAWIAESILSSAGQPEQATALRSLRLAAGSRLYADQRLAILRDLRDWAPVFADPPQGPEADLDADLAALDRIAALSGLQPEVDVLKLMRLQGAIAAAPDDLRPALVQRAADHVLATTAWPGKIARRTSLATRIEALRLALPPEDSRLALRLDAALISMMEQDDDALPFYLPQDMVLYVGALRRLLDAPPPLLTTLAEDLRFSTTAIDYSFDDYGDFAGMTPIDLVLGRSQLASAFPQVAAARLVSAAAPFWQGVALDRQSADASGDLAASLRTQSVQAQIASFDALLALFDAGSLTSIEDLSLLSTVTFWALNDLPPERVRGEDARFQAVADALAGLLHKVEETGITIPFAFPVWNLAVLADTRANKFLPVGAEDAFGATDEKVRRLILQSLVHGADWLVMRKKGEVTAQADLDTFDSGRFTYQIAFATAYIAARQRAEAGQSGPPGRCDELTSYPYDPNRRAPGVIFSRVVAVADQAVAACRKDLAQALTSDPSRVPALMYMLGRALDAADSATKAPAPNPLINVCYQAATEAGHLSAMRNLIALFPDDAVELRKVHHDLMLRDHFTEAYAALAGLEMTDRDRAALLLLARAAGDLGSVPANLLLGRTEPKTEDRVLRLLIAVDLLKDPTSEADLDLAMTARSEALALSAGFDAETLAYIQSRVAERAQQTPRTDIDLRSVLFDKYVEDAAALCR